MSVDLDALQRFAEQALGAAVSAPEAMTGGGSERRFYRLRAGERSWVAVAGSAPEGMRAFLGFTRHFASVGIPVPAILGEDPVRAWYLMEDLGPLTLSEHLRRWRGEPGGRSRALDAVREVVRWLPVIQVRGGRGLDYGLCFKGRELGRAAFQADIDQFLAHYVPRFVLRPGPDAAVRRDLARLVERLDAVPRPHFCYRDFQCRNVMWPHQAAQRGGPVFLDYQDGRRGPLHYDLASLLYSPDTGLEQAEREALFEAYWVALEQQGEAPRRDSFLGDFQAFVLMRRLQALGAYAYLAVAKGKPEYLAKIHPAVTTLRELLSAGHLRLGLPDLETWLFSALQAERTP
jgi:aminoglycoside/choline kinase family phosphotransferase